jgi:hypothetical protein
MRTVAILAAVSILNGCRVAPPEPAPLETTAAVMSELRPGMPLDDMLHVLDEHLVAAMQGRMEGEAVLNFRRAEAISDRLLEARQPFEWIPAAQYSLESRLRQVQSSADRILAQLETGASRDTMLMDLRTLRTEVVQLRETIARGGSRSPPPLDRLLADTIAHRRAPIGIGQPAQPAAPTGPQPIGTPIPPPTP